MARAFVDGLPIDWNALLRACARTRDRGFVENLRRLERLRPGHEATAAADERWRPPLAFVAVLAAAQALGGLALEARDILDGAAVDVRTARQIGLCLGFAGAGVLLAPAALRDPRAYLLLAGFFASASAFGHPLRRTAAGVSDAVWLYRGLYPEIFAVPAVWTLAVRFPVIRRFTRVDRMARGASTAAWILAVMLFSANLILAYIAAPPWLALLGRNAPGNVYWRLFAAARADKHERTRGGAPEERARALRLTAVITACTGPFLVFGLARSMPLVDQWIRSPGVRGWMDVVILGPLAALPILSGIVLFVDEPFSADRAPGPPVRDGRRGLGRLGGWHVSRRLRTRLPRALDDIRRARGARELTRVLTTELRHAFRTSHLSVLDPATLTDDTALAVLLRDRTRPLNLARHREPFVLLPRAERQWLEQCGIHMLGAVRRPDGTRAALVGIGGSDRFERGAQWYVEALLLAAGAVWPAAATDPGQEPAWECPRCGLIVADGADCCGRRATLAALPARLSGIYTVRRRLGAGGMGIAYLAADARLGRDVVLKTLPSLRDASVARLRLEATVMASLDHHGIATLYGLEEWRGTPVLVLEYLAGGTLSARVACGPLPLAAVVRVGVDVAAALRYLHDCSVLHRDVKPSNIGFTRDGRPKLLDFGLASLREELAGTRGYLPPEALAGASPDVHLDLWALARTIRECGPSDPRLDAFLDRALAPRPSDRFPSAAAFGDALAAVLAD